MKLEDEFHEIDQYNLDAEWIRQPKLYWKYAKKLADARVELDRKKTAIDVLKAEIDKAIRKNPAKFGLEKITESAIVNVITERKEFQQATEEMHEAKHGVDILMAAVMTLDHRKRALENLVDLHGQNYFSEPRAKANGKEAVDKMLKRRARRGTEEDDE